MTDPALPDTDDPNAVLEAIQVCDPGDPALARQHADAQRLLTAYLRTRSPADREALVALSGAGPKPWRFELTPLSIDALAWCNEGTERNAFTRLERAFRCSVLAVVGPDGKRHEAALASDGRRAGGVAEAEKGWSDFVARKLGRGVNAIREMGALALRRAEVTDAAADPYWPMAGAPRPAF